MDRLGDGPDYLCIGPRKTGTTWLADQLKFQPGFWMPPLQEIKYLETGLRRFRTVDPESFEVDRPIWSRVKTIVRNRGPSRAADIRFYSLIRRLSESDQIDLELYSKLFDVVPDKIVGDISPGYASLPAPMIEKLAYRFPNMRVLMFLRNPALRFWSECCMFHRRSLFDVSTQSLNSLKEHSQKPRVRSTIFLYDIYHRWSSYFDRDRLKLVFFEDIKTRPEAELQSIVRYIANRKRNTKLYLPAGLNRKRTDTKFRMLPEVREWMMAFFERDLTKCATVFGRHALQWQAELKAFQ